ncbi:MAG: DUF58 domain-containing protein [Saprospiraceae bacterium]|nr:DUF58 domain-containing protein [Saprospiraceae bacterium]MCB9325064.1 DUF58 domain-containing protein [Lewinellaceae bacterium]
MNEQEDPTIELLKKVRKIEIKTKGISRHIFSGEYHSAFKGRGMSFSEVRSYQYGDDVRNIDWNVTARTGDPYVKIFEEERELTVMLLIDMSRSAFFGTKNQFKNEILTEICAILAFSAINNNDKVGVIFFSNRIEKYIPPKKGRSHILRIIRELIDFKPQGRGTDIGKTLEYFNNVVKKRSICFLLSDFLDKDYEQALRIAARKHDIIGIQLTDPRELELPNVGLLRVEDAESGKIKWLDTASATVNAEYLKQFKDYREYSREAFVKTSADFVSINSEDDYVNELLKFFKRRTK